MLIYADNINMLGENLHIVRENTEIFIKSRKDIDLQVNSEKTKYKITSHEQNVLQNQNIIIGNISFENVEKFKQLAVMVTNANDIHEEIKYTINMGNAVCSQEKIWAVTYIRAIQQIRT